MTQKEQNTKNTKTVILVRLAFIANFNSEACPVNFPRFKIRKRLNKRKALTTESIFVLGIKKDKYIGKIEMKSMIPQKLKIYFRGF